MPVKTPRGLNIERNADQSDQVLAIALAKRWPPATWRRLLPRVLHLAARAHAVRGRLGRARSGSWRSQADLAAYLADRTTTPPMTAALLSIEGAHALDDDPANVEVVADAGIRMISPGALLRHGVRRLRARRRAGRADASWAARWSAGWRRAASSSTSPTRRPGRSTTRSRSPPGRWSRRTRGFGACCDNARNLSDEHLRRDRRDGRPRRDRVLGDGLRRPDPADIARSIAYAVDADRRGPRRARLGLGRRGPVPFDAANVVRLTDALLDVGLTRPRSAGHGRERAAPCWRRRCPPPDGRSGTGRSEPPTRSARIGRTAQPLRVSLPRPRDPPEPLVTAEPTDPNAVAPAVAEPRAPIVSLSKRRGFIFPSSEIYGGINAVWDYGPLGVELKNNVKRAWWRAMVQDRNDIVGLDAGILMHPQVWVTSGHVGSFSDPLVECADVPPPVPPRRAAGCRGPVRHGPPGRDDRRPASASSAPTTAARSRRPAAST